jgi:ribose transport system permease protein
MTRPHSCDNDHVSIWNINRLANGLIVSYLESSIYTTLGMMLLVRGAALYYVGGAPQGYLTENWRAFGRNYFENVPVFGRVP